MAKIKSIGKAQAVETIQAGGSIVETFVEGKVDGYKQLVPALTIHDSTGARVGKVSNLVFGQLLNEKVIKKAPLKKYLYEKA